MLRNPTLEMPGANMNQSYGEGGCLPNLQHEMSADMIFGLDASLKEVRTHLRRWFNQVPSTQELFEPYALSLFRWQVHHNSVYHRFVTGMGVVPESVDHVLDIPCMPVEMFKRHAVQSGTWTPVHAFRSSGTSHESMRATHWLDADAMSWYRDVSRRAWQVQWGLGVEGWDWLALLPGYTGRDDASLLTMVQDFMGPDIAEDRMLMDRHPLWNDMLLGYQPADGRRLVMVGVTWAILDWLEGPHAPSRELVNHLRQIHPILLETGGMKGRGEEPIRDEVQTRYRTALPGVDFASEYGMTELMSQAYAIDGIHHNFPPWMRPIVRDARDPRCALPEGRTGRLDIIDLANVHSCAFLATSDLAKWTSHGLLVQGRVDHSEVRGCSLLANA